MQAYSAAYTNDASVYASSVAYTKDAFVYASSSMAIIVGEINGLES